MRATEERLREAAGKRHPTRKLRVGRKASLGLTANARRGKGQALRVRSPDPVSTHKASGTADGLTALRAFDGAGTSQICELNKAAPRQHPCLCGVC